LRAIRSLEPVWKSVKQLKDSSLFWCGITATAGVVLIAIIFPLEVAIVGLSVLFTHEFSHFLAARFVGAEAKWPIFIPLVVFLVGFTRIKNINTKDISFVALSGPIVGMVVALIAIAIGFLLGSSVLILAAGWSFVFELFAATLGKDGKQARMWRNKMKMSFD